jgi:hypothetical protein
MISPARTLSPTMGGRLVNAPDTSVRPRNLKVC